MDILSWPLVGWLIRTGWTMWAAIRGSPKVSYVGDGSGFVLVERDGTLRIGLEGELRNDGRESSTVQEACLKLVAKGELYTLEVEKGWDSEFIGQPIDGHGGQLPIYPHFLCKNAGLHPNTDVTATLRVRVWPKTILKKKLRLAWR